MTHCPLLSLSGLGSCWLLLTAWPLMGPGPPTPASSCQRPGQLLRFRLPSAWACGSALGPSPQQPHLPQSPPTPPRSFILAPPRASLEAGDGSGEGRPAEECGEGTPPWPRGSLAGVGSVRGIRQPCLRPPSSLPRGWGRAGDVRACMRAWCYHRRNQCLALAQCLREMNRFWPRTKRV